MSVDRREFLKRLSLVVAALTPAALIAGCTRQVTEPVVDATPPATDPDPHEGHDHGEHAEGTDADGDGHDHDEHAEGTDADGEGDPVLGTDPAEAPEGSLVFECPECHQMNALPGYEAGDELPMLKCRICGHVWQPA